MYSVHVHVPWKSIAVQLSVEYYYLAVLFTCMYSRAKITFYGKSIATGSQPTVNFINLEACNALQHLQDFIHTPQI